MNAHTGRVSGIRVFKLGGRTQRDPRLPSVIASLVDGGKKVVVVHGGGDQITELQRLAGREPKFIQGRRVTTLEDLELVRMVLSGSSNKELVAGFMSAGVRAIGVSGEDGALIGGARAFDGALGEVGTPVHIDPSLLFLLLEHGYTPVISPVARNVVTGQPLNVNGDDAAAALAIALGAQELTFVADVAGVLAPDGRLIRELSTAEAETLIQAGTATGGMVAKLQAAQPALRAGVCCVRIAGLTGLTEAGGGTVLHREIPVHAK